MFTLFSHQRSPSTSSPSPSPARPTHSSPPREHHHLFGRRRPPAPRQRSQSVSNLQALQVSPPSPPLLPSELLDRPEEVQEALARLRDLQSQSQKHLYGDGNTPPSFHAPRVNPRLALRSASSSALFPMGLDAKEAQKLDQDEDGELPMPSRPWSDPGHPPLQRKRVNSLPPAHSPLSPAGAQQTAKPPAGVGGFAFPKTDPQDFLTPVERWALQRRYDDATIGLAQWEERALGRVPPAPAAPALAPGAAAAIISQNPAVNLRQASQPPPKLANTYPRTVPPKPTRGLPAQPLAATLPSRLRTRGQGLPSCSGRDSPSVVPASVFAKCKKPSQPVARSPTSALPRAAHWLEADEWGSFPSPTAAEELESSSREEPGAYKSELLPPNTSASKRVSKVRGPRPQSTLSPTSTRSQQARSDAPDLSPSSSEDNQHFYTPAQSSLSLISLTHAEHDRGLLSSPERNLAYQYGTSSVPERAKRVPPPALVLSRPTLDSRSPSWQQTLTPALSSTSTLSSLSATSPRSPPSSGSYEPQEFVTRGQRQWEAAVARGMVGEGKRQRPSHRPTMSAPSLPSKPQEEALDFLTPGEKFALQRTWDAGTLGMAPSEEQVFASVPVRREEKAERRRGRVSFGF